jgi:integrase
MEQHLFPAFGNIPISTLRAPTILPALREIEAKGNHETAKRQRQYCEAVFTFAISTGIAERNVGADLRGALAPCRATNRPAIIDPKGVAQLLRAIDGYQVASKPQDIPSRVPIPPDKSERKLRTP